MMSTCHWAIEALKELPLQSLTDVFIEMSCLSQAAATIYQFNIEATELLTNLQSQEIAIINSAVAEGNPPTKNKTAMELIARVSACLHIFNNIAKKLLKGERPERIPKRILKKSVEHAQKFVEYTNSQKRIFATGICNW